MVRAWHRFKRWYLGGEYPKDYIRSLRVGWGPIPMPGEVKRELDARRAAEAWLANYKQGEDT